ncbi:hypothetical protein AAF712_004874 [Marasmius tenuissimus]|uniref:Uncharacterized protein n=1 Tax=Marasmius tenuissimus TaxID=585030 RepID=A0ABR3A1U9_9AGAR
MATPTATDPKQLQVYLLTMVLTLHANDSDHPLLGLGDTACTYMVALTTKDPAHQADEKGYRGFYSIVRDIVRRFENLQAEGKPKPAHVRLCHLEKYCLRRLKGKLDSAYKTASAVKSQALRMQMGRRADSNWGVVSTISAAPGLDLLKPVGSVLSQLGELAKTTRSNKAEYVDLLCLAATILAELTTKFRVGHVKPTEDMQRSVRNFERTLVRIRNSITELKHEPRAKRLGRLLFANKTKEELAGLQKELERAQMVFMVRSFSFTIDAGELIRDTTPDE